MPITEWSDDIALVDLGQEPQLSDDLGALLAIWGFTNPPYGDLNGDGVVDGIDLGQQLANWGPLP